jgi:hypothetical protein
MPLTQIDPALLAPTAQYTGFKNRIINGAMMIDQRNAGASVTNSTGNIYTLDRWLNVTVGSSCSVQQVAGTGNNKAIRVTGASGNSTTQLTQRIEANNIYDCASQTVTVSFTLYGSGSGSVSVRFLYPTATDNFTTQTEPVAGTTVNFTTTPTTYTVTRTLDANANKGLVLVFERGATGAGVTWTLENVQLEKGSTATSFDYRPYGTELALCQRYFQKSFPHDTAPVQNAGISTVSGNCLGGGYGTLTTVRFATVMRSGPTITGFNPSAANDRVRNNSIGADIQYVGIGSNYNSGFVFYPYGANHDSGVQGYQWAWNWTASAEL